jgi:hypothetical protein
MRLIFSRKGFDSAAGKAPSPIIDGEPISLPIPTERRSETSYRLAGFGDVVEHVTKGRIGADELCHEDPVFANGRWAFGQTGAAQTHLETNGVGVGDVFLFLVCSQRTMAGIVITGYSDTWKSMKFADWEAAPPKMTIPKDFCGDIRIRSESGTRIIRFTSARGARRKARPLAYVSPSPALGFPSGACRHGSRQPG